MNDALSSGLKALITDILKFDPKDRMSLKEALNCKWINSMYETIEKCADQVQVDPPNHLHLLLAQKVQDKQSIKTNSTVKKDKK